MGHRGGPDSLGIMATSASQPWHWVFVKKEMGRSLVSLGKAVAYIALAATALSLALRHPSDSTENTQQASGTILSLPGGQALLIAVGLITAGIGGYFVYKGVRRKFHEDISLPTGGAGKAVDLIGIAGYVAKGIAIVTLGFLFIVAAVKVDPQDASGLDGALKALVALPFGEAILLVIACGLMAYGLYSFARAKLANL